MLAVGLVVDDAIVVVENVERHLREGEAPFKAALEGARELVGPIIATTITLAAVYAPIAQGGLTGSLFPGIHRYSGGRGYRIKRGGFDSLADDGLHGFQERALKSRAYAASSIASSTDCGNATERWWWVP